MPFVVVGMKEYLEFAGLFRYATSAIMITVTTHERKDTNHVGNAGRHEQQGEPGLAPGR